MSRGKFKHVEKNFHHLLSKTIYNRSHSSQHTQCSPFVIATHFRDQLHCQEWSNNKCPNKVIFIPNEVASKTMEWASGAADKICTLEWASKTMEWASSTVIQLIGTSIRYWFPAYWNEHQRLVSTQNRIDDQKVSQHGRMPTPVPPNKMLRYGAPRFKALPKNAQNSSGEFQAWSKWEGKFPRSGGRPTHWPGPWSLGTFETQVSTHERKRAPSKTSQDVT